MPMVYKGLQSSFVSLSWPWPGRSLPQGEPVGVLGPWTWIQCGRAPSFLPPTIWPSWSLTGWHFCTWLVGWPIAAGRLADWLSKNVNLTLPLRQRHLVAKCATTLVRLTFGQMYPPGRVCYFLFAFFFLLLLQKQSYEQFNLADIFLHFLFSY